METGFVVAVAQIATGIATLVVALFLAAQLFLQRKQLEIAHQDSFRELGFAARTRNEELLLARLTNKSLLNSYMKGGASLETPSDEETHQFINYILSNIFTKAFFYYTHRHFTFAKALHSLRFC